MLLHAPGRQRRETREAKKGMRVGEAGDEALRKLERACIQPKVESQSKPGPSTPAMQEFWTGNGRKNKGERSGSMPTRGGFNRTTVTLQKGGKYHIVGRETVYLEEAENERSTRG